MLYTVKNLQQQTFTVELEDTKTVKELKEKIEEIKGAECPALRQRLIYAGKILNDESALNEYNIEESKFIVLMVTKPAPEATATKSAATTSSVTTPAVKTETKVESKTEAKATAPETKAQASVTETKPAADQESASNLESVRSQAESQLVSGSDLENVIMNIMEMGYERSEVERALQASFNNPERAVEYLVNGEIPTNEELGDLVGSQDSDRASQGTGSESGNPLEFLRSQPQYQQMCQLLRQNPHLLETMMQQLGTSNPRLLELIHQNQSAFIQMVNETNSDADTGSENAPANPANEPNDPALDALQSDETQHTINLSPSDREAIDRLKGLGFPEYLVVQAYFACDKNETLAANFLFSSDN